MQAARALLLYLLTVTVLGGSWIVPGAVWTDTDGKKIDAHGGGIIKRDGTFYWIGHSASNNETPMVYSSTDLLNWKNLGAQNSITGLWRPKFALPNNGSFWIFGQQDRYVRSLKSSNPIGGYQPVAKVHLPPDDYTYSDTGMFYDESTSTWYLLTSADHNDLQINQINSDGSVGKKVSDLKAGSYEAPGLFKVDGVYFLIVSGKTGWRSNPNKMFWSTSIAGPWTGGTDIAPPDVKTYNSQNTFELTIKGSSRTTYVYMGDSWDSKGGPTSNYIWLPMDVKTSDKSITLQNHEMWKVDPSTGLVSFPSTKETYEAENGTLSGRATVIPCSYCSSKRAVNHLLSGSAVTFHNVSGAGKREWLSLYYTVNDPDGGEAYITINNESALVSALNSRAGYNSVVPVEVMLRSGGMNTIRFEAIGRSGFEVVLDRIELYEG